MKRKNLRFGRGFRVALGNRRSQAAGSLVLIEAGDRHEVRAPGRKPMRSLDFYVPPAYDRTGDELPPGKR